jgi:phage virion morphogenesis protein
MTNQITIEHNSPTVLEALQELMVQLDGQLSVPMERISGVMARAIERNFADEKDPATGAPWQPLSEETTIPFRAEKGYWPGQILQMRGELASAVAAQFGDDWATVTNNKVYAAIQHFGGNTSSKSWIPGVEIPARPFMGLTKEDDEAILDIIAEYLR